MVRLFHSISFSLSCALLFVVISAKRELTEQEKQLARDSGVDPDSLSEDTIFITPPVLSDEEKGSKLMPAAYKCDGCTVIAYQLNKRFAAAERKKKKGDPLSEGEILEVVDDLCADEFTNYGLKNIQGTKMFSGEGLPAEKMSGMVETGGIWMKRLQDTCKELAGELEEELIYKMYLKKKVPFKLSLCKHHCPSKMLLSSEKDEL